MAPHLKANLINGLLRIHNCKHNFKKKNNKTSFNENNQLQRAKAHKIKHHNVDSFQNALQEPQSHLYDYIKKSEFVKLSLSLFLTSKL